MARMIRTEETSNGAFVYEVKQQQTTIGEVFKVWTVASCKAAKCRQRDHYWAFVPIDDFGDRVFGLDEGTEYESLGSVGQAVKSAIVIDKPSISAQVMRKAHEIRKNAEIEFGKDLPIHFGICLKLAWELVRKPKRESRLGSLPVGGELSLQPLRMEINHLERHAA